MKKPSPKIRHICRSGLSIEEIPASAGTLSSGGRQNRTQTLRNSNTIGITIAVVLCLLTFPCFGGDFFWENSNTDSAYMEHLNWQKSFQWHRKQAFQIYKKHYRHYLRQRKAKLQKKLRNRNSSRMERQQSELKKKWDAEQRAYQTARLKITKEYINNRNRHRKQKKPGDYSPQKTKYNREFVL